MKKFAAFFVLLMTVILLQLAPGQKAQAGAILYADDMQVEVLWQSEGNRAVLIHKYNDVDTETLTIPDKVWAGGYEWKIIGIKSGAFKSCTTPKEIIINPSMDFYRADPDAFVNGAVQTIKVNPADGEWDTLYPILEYMSPANKKYPNSVPNGEDTLYVTVPAGTYTLPEEGYEIRVYGNTTLYLKGVTFKRNTSEKGLKCHMLSLGTTGKTMTNGTVNAKGYDGGKNIKILYGTFDNGTVAGANNIVRMSHLYNVKIYGTVFKYLPKTKVESNMTNSHCIELAGCKKVTIQSCKFYNNENCKFDNEAVQIESCSSDPNAKAHTNISAPLDNTQTSYVTITKCRFEGFNYGCGSNHLGPDDRYSNMKFTYNTFVGCQKYCVCLYQYKSATVSHNKMKNCSTLILEAGPEKSAKVTKKYNKTVK